MEMFKQAPENEFAKLSSFQFYQLAKKQPEAFDETYNVLADEESKKPLTGTLSTVRLMPL